MHIECMYVYLIYIFASVLVVVLTQTHSTYIGLRIHKMSKIKIKNYLCIDAKNSNDNYTFILYYF